jgi:peptide subunit release factor 1 (eRF1)
MMSDFTKSFLGRSGMTVYTQKEFDEQLAIGKAEIMQIAIDTTKTAIAIEREECAKILDRLAEDEDEGELCTALRNAAEAIRNRLKK